MLGRFQFTTILALALCLSAVPSRAQILGNHYRAGTEGIQAGSLPGPGIYFNDINLGEYSHWSVNAVQNTVDEYRISTYINEPRFRWLSHRQIFGGNFGVGLAIPLIFQKEQAIMPPYNGPGIPFFVPGKSFNYSQFEVGDLEISPLLLSWHLRQFDFSLGYSVWVPTGDNTLTLVDLPQNPSAAYAPAQCHWWEHMITLGGTWHPDAAGNWSVSMLNHYEINQSFALETESADYGQLFTMEWGLSRRAGKYFELGLVGNYSRQTTATGIDRANFADLAFSDYSNVAVGPEIKVTSPRNNFSASLRYLRETIGSPGKNLNVVALTLSQGF